MSKWCWQKQLLSLQARTLIESIASSSAFARLPGAARVLIVNQIMTMLAQELVWPAFSAAGQHQPSPACADGACVVYCD